MEEKIMKNILSLLLLFTFSVVYAQEEGPVYIKPHKSYRYRVYFTDKKHNTFSTKRPEAFLSQKALERRRKYKIKVDQYDLPVTPLYLDYLNNNGFKVLHTSKWNNTAVVDVQDTTLVSKLDEVKFIAQYRKVWESPDSVLVYPNFPRAQEIENRRDTLTHFYGAANKQIEMLNLEQLHSKELMGKGITIAVIDGGFYNTDCVEGLKDCNIISTKNFVSPQKSVYEESQQHGTMVLSCIAAHLPKCMIGTAPEASFHLIISEDNDSENLIEEDNWCAAVEYADSIGADIVTSSLGYYKFDDPTVHHRYYELDGMTAVNSRSASLAASRGLLLINSAGNEGDNSWKKIGFPADGKNIIAVGAVNNKRINTEFSSIGNTADGRIKPDVMALGADAAVIDFRGNVTRANGTSFSAPILCGAAACLLQAYPEKKPEEIIRAIQKAGDNAMHPDNIMGYGIPDMWKAFEYLKEN